MLVNCVDINGVQYIDMNGAVYKSNIKNYKQYQYVDINHIPYVSPAGLIYVNKRLATNETLKIWNSYIYINGQFQLIRPYIGSRQSNGTIKFILADNYIASTIIQQLPDEVLTDDNNNILIDNRNNVILK